ncbi:TPA: hypothetical protein ACH3X2_010361 [Trebouxia sp. C0005]
MELERLARLLKYPAPSDIIVLTGPPDAGKTAVLQQAVGRRKSEARATLYINCREKDYMSSQAFAAQFKFQLIEQFRSKALKDFAFTTLDSLSEFRSFVMRLGPTVSPIRGSAFKQFLQHFQSPSITALDDVLKDFVGFLRACKKGPVLPTIIIDEASQLQQWKESENNQLDALLRFFVLVTKEAKLAHVVLATSESFFEYWLSERVGHHRFTVRVIGDFTEKLAKEFFSKHCVPNLSEVLVPSYEWQKIWEVCGGRPKLLLACVERAAETLNWTDAVQSLIDDAMRATTQPLHPACLTTRTEKPLWTTAEFKKVMKILTDAPHNAVAEPDMQAMLGGRGDEILRSFILHNVLHVRHAADLRNKVDAHGNSLLDIPADPQGRKIITAVSPAQQFAMKRLVDQLLTS